MSRSCSMRSASTGSYPDRTVVVDHDLGKHRWRGAAGPDRRELLLGELDGPLHLLLGFEERLVDHVLRRLLLETVARRQAAVMSVPILSPLSARMMVSSPSAAKTTIGSRLSMHRLNAAASTTRRPCRSASSKVTVSSLLAVGSTRGSAV